MTQHDETGTATDQPAPTPGQPTYPSPYLDTGESAPQAYLAPPQPGQPKYGAPTRLGPGRPPLASPRQAVGQSGNQQPGYGRPGSTRGGTGPAARRDPAIATPWERLVATVLDWILILVIASLAFISPLLRISRQLRAVSAHYTDQQYSPGAQGALDAVFREPSNQRALLFLFIAMFGIALAYYWVQHAAWGATLGKRALGCRVVNATDRSAIGIRTAGIRTIAFLVGPAAFWLLLSPLNYAGGLLWLADTGLSLFDSQVQCLHDKLAGTIVIRQRWLDQQARSARPW
jgi:uncharacterized RDD family membrane protein YckC